MIVVGIDVASRKSDICIMKDLKILETLTIKHTLEDFERLHHKIETLKKSLKDSNVIIGMEHTAHYSNIIHYHMCKYEYNVSVINPCLIKSDTSSRTMKKTKNDKVDALSIAKYMKSHLEELRFSNYENSNCETKSAVRYRHRLSRIKNACINRIWKSVDLIYPEVHSHFKNIEKATFRAFLIQYPSNQAIITENLTKLTNFLRTYSRGHFGKETALELKKMAKNSIGINNLGESSTLVMAVKELNSLYERIEEIEKVIEDLSTPSQKIIESIPGINKRLASQIASEIGDITRFKTFDSLYGYTGLEVSVIQSGLKESFGPITKRGSSYLRYALFVAASEVRLHTNTFKEYYDSKIKEGKHYYVAVIATSKKLIRTIYYMLKHNKNFIDLKATSK